MINEKSTPLEKAIAAVGGRQNKLAEKVGLTPQAITQLKKRGGSLPTGKISVWVTATGLSREILYPEIFNTAA